MKLRWNEFNVRKNWYSPVKGQKKILEFYCEKDKEWKEVDRVVNTICLSDL